MNELRLSKNDAIEAYKNGSTETREVLKKLFPNIRFCATITDRIDNWSDVMDALNIKQSNIDRLSKAVDSFTALSNRDKRCIKAFVKVLCIVRALNGKWELSERDCGLESYIHYIDKDCISSDAPIQPHDLYINTPCNESNWTSIPQLAFKTNELAVHAVTHFPDIWREYYNNYEQDM